jgi:hypothetical protein
MPYILGLKQENNMNYIQIERLGLTNSQVKEWSEQHGYKCESKEDYLANAQAMKYGEKQDLIDYIDFTRPVVKEKRTYKTELRLDDQTHSKLQDIRKYIDNMGENKLSGTKISMSATLRYCISYVWAHIGADKAGENE